MKVHDVACSQLHDSISDATGVRRFFESEKTDVLLRMLQEKLVVEESRNVGFCFRARHPEVMLSRTKRALQSYTTCFCGYFASHLIE